MTGSLDPFMFALGCVFLIVMLVYWSGAFIYKKIKGLPTGECSSCSSKKNVNRMVRDVKKELDNEIKCECKKKSS